MIQHVACVMDGNRRWAKQHGVSLKEGVLQGLARASTAVDFCLKHEIKYLSLYAFSVENLQRSAIERACVFDTLVERGVKYAQDMAKKDVKVRIVGDHALFPDNVRDICTTIETITGQCDRIFLQFLFCYGGRQEIVAAAKTIAEQVKSGQLDTTSITEESFKKYTWMGELPDPELVIRSGFANRLSNFLL
jgi:undecaprenyl diphosphate synthase